MIFINEKEDEDIYNMLEVSIKNKDIEFELLYGTKRVDKKIISTITKENFVNLSTYLNENYNFYESNNTLDIRYLRKDKFNSEQSDKRLTIVGIDDIKKYCLTNLILSDMNLLIIDKKKHDIEGIKNTYINKNYDYKINLKKEVLITDNIDEIVDTFNNNKKIFRYKKRYSYLTNNKLWRIDLTVIKSSEFNTKFNTYDYHDSFKSANILNKKEMYELEVEYVGSNIKLNTGLYAIENYIKNKDYFSDNPSIYNPFHNKINIGFDKDYSYDKDQLSSKVNYKEYINKRVQILDTYWDKNTDEKIKEDIGDNDIIIKEVYNNYDGDIAAEALGVNLFRYRRIGG